VAMAGWRLANSARHGHLFTVKDPAQGHGVTREALAGALRREPLRRAAALALRRLLRGGGGAPPEHEAEVWAHLLGRPCAAAFPRGHHLIPAVPPLADWADLVDDLEAAFGGFWDAFTPAPLLAPPGSDANRPPCPVPLPGELPGAPDAPGARYDYVLRWPWEASNAATAQAIIASTPAKLAGQCMARVGSGLVELAVQLRASKDAVLMGHLLNTAGYIYNMCIAMYLQACVACSTDCLTYRRVVVDNAHTRCPVKRLSSDIIVHLRVPGTAQFQGRFGRHCAVPAT